MANILITGALGFIGRKVFEFFLNLGNNVCGWDIKEGMIRDQRVYKVDMRKSEEISLYLDKFRPDIIIHCAGSADVPMSIKYPDIDFNGNVAVTHNLLFALAKNGIFSAKFIFLSSAAVYGTPKRLPVHEDDELNPLSPYAVHKVLCENLCKYFSRNFKMDVKILRIFSAYGSGLKKQIFWDMYNRYLSTGSLLMFGTGNESRDYIHINDLLMSIYLISKNDSPYDIFNIANGTEITIKTAVDTFVNVFDIPKDSVKFNGIIREGEPLNWKADITRIKELGYKRSVDLRNGLEEYKNWIIKVQ